MHDWFFLTFIVTSGTVGAAIFAISALFVYGVKDWVYGLVFDGDGPGDAGSPIQMKVRERRCEAARGMPPRPPLPPTAALPASSSPCLLTLPSISPAHAMPLIFKPFFFRSSTKVRC